MGDHQQVTKCNSVHVRLQHWKFPESPQKAEHGSQAKSGGDHLQKHNFVNNNGLTRSTGACMFLLLREIGNLFLADAQKLQDEPENTSKAL